MKHLLALTLFMTVFVASSVHAATWPASSDGTSIGANLMATDSTFEPSGIEWHSGRSQFVVVGDEGQVATMNADGSNVQMWKLGSSYDLEGVAIADASSSKVYLLDENNSSAREFDLATGALTGKSWSFSDKLSEVNGAGAEALAYANGSFYVGWQYDGDIYVYSANLEVSGSQSFTQEIHMTSGYTDISGLTYNGDTQRLYALYDGLNLLEERDVQGTLLASYSVPGSNQEGVALVNTGASSTATITIAEDSGAVMSYTGYPVTYITSSSSSTESSSSTTTTPETTPEPTPEPTPAPAPTVSSVAGTTNGDINVTYSDGTTRTYDIFAVKSKTNTTVRVNIFSTEYTLATLGRYAALVDPMTGDIYASTVFAKGDVHPLKWAHGVLGI